MSTMNISLPDEMKAFIDEQVATRGFGTSSEYVRDLLRREQDRLHLRQLILDGVASGRGVVADETYFESLRRRIRDKAADRSAAAATKRKTRSGTARSR